MLHGRRRLLIAAVTALAGPLLAVPALAASSEQIRIEVSPGIRSGSAYNLTVAGSSLQRARVYLFVDYSGCARTLTVERRRNPGALDSYRVQGTFTEVSGWRSSAPGMDHACAYMVSPSGRVLASSRRSYLIG